MTKQNDELSNGKSVLLRLNYALAILLFLVTEANGVMLVIKRNEFHLHPSVFSYFIPLFLAIPLLVGLNAYKQLSTRALDESLVRLFRGSVLGMVVSAYVVLISIMAMLTNSLVLTASR